MRLVVLEIIFKYFGQVFIIPVRAQTHLSDTSDIRPVNPALIIPTGSALEVCPAWIPPERSLVEQKLNECMYFRYLLQMHECG